MRTIIAAVTFFALAHCATAVIDRSRWINEFSDEGALCSLDCIHRVFARYCQGMPCLTTHPTKRTLKKLCVDTCILGLMGNKMRRCLKRGFPENDNVDGMMELLLFEAYQYCDGEVLQTINVDQPTTFELDDLDEAPGPESEPVSVFETFAALFASEE